MSIESGAILVGGTTSTTGGTSTPMITKGDTLGEKRMILDDSSEYIAQTSLSFTVKDPVVSSGAPNGFTQQRSQLKVLVPLALDNGNRTFNTITIVVATDPETTSSEKDALIELGVQALNGSAFADFWKAQSLS